MRGFADVLPLTDSPLSVTTFSGHCTLFTVGGVPLGDALRRCGNPLHRTRDHPRRRGVPLGEGVTTSVEWGGPSSGGVTPSAAGYRVPLFVDAIALLIGVVVTPSAKGL